MKTSKKWLVVTVLSTVIFAWMAFSYPGGKEEWKVPDEYVSKKNPIKADDESIDVGSSLYSKHCKACHGKYGEGDGPKAAELKTPMDDFTSEEFQEQPDGALFYKIITGRDEMPDFRKKMPDDEDVWDVINYVRTLGE